MINPIFRREITTSLRSLKAYIGIMIYVLIMCGLSAVVLYMINPNNYSFSFSPADIVQFYIVLSTCQYIIIFIVVPALSAGAISSEREKQTLNLLLVTKMSPLKITLGKLQSSLSKVLLMIIASMPVYSIVFYYGGISLWDLISMILYTMLVAATIGSISIFLSAVFKKSMASTVVSYIILLAMTIGNFAFMALSSLFLERASYSYSYYYDKITLVNQINKYLDVISGGTVSISFLINIFVGVSNPAVGFASLMEKQYGSDTVSYGFYSMSGLYSVDNHIPFYIYNAIINVLIIIVMVFLTSRVLIPVKKSRRFK